MPQRSTSISREHIYAGRNLTGYQSGRYSLHCHPQYEIYLFVRGQVDYRVEGVEYHLAPGSLILLSPGCFHGYRPLSCAPYERYSLHFDAELIAPAAREALLAPFLPGGAHYQLEDMAPLAAAFEALLRCGAMSGAAAEELARARALCIVGMALEISARAQGERAFCGQDRALASRLLCYINAHLDQPVTLDTLAAQFYFSKSYINRVFTRATGASVAGYVSRKRLQYAQQMIASGLTQAEAARRAGFLDYSTYYRTRRRMERAAP